jgi:sodium-dependent dicarboxylate transporter 2/3/5
MKNLSDGVIAMVCAMLLFIIPVDWQKGIFILEKKSINKIPWDAILLFGGGLSIASSIEKTKLAEWMGKKLGFIGVLPLYFQILLIVSLIIFLTELTSNIATTAVFLPILSSIAINLGENPLLFVIPATISASCAFMLPVATPPNAIVYASGLVKISDMTKAGFLLNIIFIFVITIIILFIGIPALNIK